MNRAPGPPEAPPPLDAVAAETPPPLAPEDGPVGSRAAIGVASPVEALAPLSNAAISVLTWGFRSGALLLAAGVGLALIRREPLNRVADPFAEVLPAVRAGRAAGLVDLAILWLMTVPVAVVLVVAVGFLRRGERRYFILSLLVLAVLGTSIGLALGR